MKTLSTLLLLGACAAVARADWPAGLDVGGFVDASYVADPGMGTDGFGLDQAEIDLSRDDGPTALRLDVDWSKAGEAWAADVEQAWMDWRVGGNLTLRAGKFNAPIGVEALDAPDMFQFSHSLLFDNCAPTNLSGLQISTAFGGLDASLLLANGWDQNDETDDAKTLGLRLAGALAGADLGLTVLHGREDVLGPGTVRTVFDVDGTLELSDALTLAIELNLGSVAPEVGDAATWTGASLSSRIGLGERLGLTLRADWLDDPDGWLFGAVDGETRTAFTAAPTVSLGDGLGALLEVRWDTSDVDAFLDKDGPTDSQLSVAVEMTMTF